MYINQEDAENSCDYTLFSNRRLMVRAYTKYDVQLIKVAPDDGLTEFETCTASNGK